MTSSSPLDRLLEKAKNLIPIPPQKQKETKSKKDEPLVKSTEKEDKGSSKCPHRFGYLTELPKKAPIPEECLTCQKLLECGNG